jgi:bacteriorhodopsin
MLVLPFIGDLLSISSYLLLFGGYNSRLLAHKKIYSCSAVYITVIWLLYPVCWGISEGGNVITVDHEMIFYGILDIFAGPIFLFAFLAGLRNVEYDSLGLQSGKASDYVGGLSSASAKAQEARGESTA